MKVGACVCLKQGRFNESNKIKNIIYEANSKTEEYESNASIKCLGQHRQATCISTSMKPHTHTDAPLTIFLTFTFFTAHQTINAHKAGAMQQNPFCSLANISFDAIMSLLCVC